MNAEVTFKGKPQEAQSFIGGELVSGMAVKVPAITRQHFTDQTCTLAKIGTKFVDGYVRRLTGGWVMLDYEYPGVIVDASGFLAKVTIEVVR